MMEIRFPFSDDIETQDCHLNSAERTLFGTCIIPLSSF